MCTVEVKTVNHRFLEVSFRLPRALQEHEAALRKRLAQTLARGSASVVVMLDDEFGDAGVPSLNRSVAAAYLRELEALRQREGLAGQVEVGTLAVLPETFTMTLTAVPSRALATLARRALDQALERVEKERCREGEALAKDFRARVVRVEGLLKKIERRAPVRTKELRTRFIERLKGIKDAPEVDSTRLAQELALLAERLDFTEECVRLITHAQQFKELLADSEPVGRRLNFLLQEMGREANTVGSKAQDPKISMWVVDIKEELEKLREQAQNVE